MAEKKQVNDPIIPIINNISNEYSNKYEQLIIKKTPAVTIVAACIKAETGVGPSMASANQVCKPNWADFPMDPKNKNNEIKNNKLNW